MTLTDLHSHLVPAVDDGAASVEEALDSLAGLQAEGVGTLVTTPHLLLPHLSTDAAIDRELERHRRAFDRLAEAALEAGDLPALGLGQEIWAPDARLLRRIVRRPGIGLAGTRWLLVEFGFDLEGTHEGVVREAVAAGRGIVVAHPERYRYLPGIEPLDLMRRWRELGALLQINAGSFTGHYRGSSPDSERLAWEMVTHGLVDLVATDHHGTRRMGVSLRDAFGALAARGEQELADRVMARAPGAMVREAGAELVGPALRSPAAGG
ncbi:MAG TPA: CpsB/CapC family capsule biosynthesis tyrosine phosphatase [Gemmatimonadales bacterium]|nr:CpsB/CapC family capsule biosynthesis tyrosine phosphatase [Gemmatimonadales bacterium]